MDSEPGRTVTTRDTVEYPDMLESEKELVMLAVEDTMVAVEST